MRTGLAVPRDALALAALHRFVEQRVPRLVGVFPRSPRGGDTVTLLGSGLAGRALVARFGAVETALMTLSDGLALAVVPAGGERGPVSLRAPGVASNYLALAGEGGPPPWVWRVDPAHGATGVPRDLPVTLRLSHVLQRGPVQGVEVLDDRGVVPGDLRLSADRRMVAWWSRRPLAPGVVHRVRAAGLVAAGGRAFAPHASAFRPGEQSLADAVG